MQAADDGHPGRPSPPRLFQTIYENCCFYFKDDAKIKAVYNFQTPTTIFRGIIVSPGIEPGNIVFPSHKKIMYRFYWRTAVNEKKRNFSSAPGLSVMTLHECRVDHPFPVT